MPRLFVSAHYSDVIMDAMVYQITSLTIVYLIVYSGADQRKHQRSASLAFVRGIHRWPVNSSHKWPVPRKMFPFDDVIMRSGSTMALTMQDICVLVFHEEVPVILVLINGRKCKIYLYVSCTDWDLATWILINIDSGNSLLSDGTKPLPAPYSNWLSICEV